jgi:hypothetical protein
MAIILEKFVTRVFVKTLYSGNTSLFGKEIF